jgi:hypothetical protein
MTRHTLDPATVAELACRLAALETASNAHHLDDTDMTWSRQQDRADEYRAALTGAGACVFFARGCRLHGYPYCPDHQPEPVRPSHPVADSNP